MSKQNRDLANSIRFLSIDAVEKANSGHPGLPMGMADVATILFKYYLKFNPKNPSWLNRDRFVLSAGHGSMLLYSLLYLTGYKSISLNSIKNFRQLNSICAGHPEYEPNSGIETTTGPLGQGVGNAVGMAVAECILRKQFGNDVIDHYTYLLHGDGDIQEPVAQGAIALAGHWGWGKLIAFYDANDAQISGRVSRSDSTNYAKFYDSNNWHVQEIDGHNRDAIRDAICNAMCMQLLIVCI